MQIAHDHVAHHFFVGVPFCEPHLFLTYSHALRALADVMTADNLPAVTEAIRPVLGAHYCYDSTVRVSLSSLWVC